MKIKKEKQPRKPSLGKLLEAQRIAIAQQIDSLDLSKPEDIKRYKELTQLLAAHCDIRKEDRVTASNITQAATCLVGTGGAIAYDAKHNFPSAGRNFLVRPPQPKN